MASYRLRDKALADLDRLYEHGVLTFGLQRADDYYDSLVSHFQELAQAPKRYQAVDSIRRG